MPAAPAELLDAEVHFLGGLRSQYEAQGYEFIIHPRKLDLPPFLSSYQPDAIARKPGNNIAIEVKSRGRSTNQQTLQSIRRLFDGHPDWQFTVMYAGSDPQYEGLLPVMERASILNRAQEVLTLSNGGHSRAAFTTAWSLLEAALNSASPNTDGKPRTPGTIVQTLAMNGHISPEIEQRLRALIPLRNRIVHGDLTVEPTEADIRLVLSAVTSTLS